MEPSQVTHKFDDPMRQYKGRFKTATVEGAV